MLVALATALPVGAQAPAGRAAPGARAGSRAPESGPGEILGLVVASESGRPLPGAAVHIRTLPDSGVVASVTASGNGRFRVSGLPVGRYVVRASSLGYAPSMPRHAEVTGGAPRVELGTLALTVAPVAVRAVEVRAERPTVVAASDRTIYSVAALPASAGGTAADLLRQIPELEVAADGSVSLRGSSSVAIQLNGRAAPLRGEALRNYLRQLPATRIEQVEVVPNPSAKDDPEGMAGIVNLVLRQLPDLGASGTLSGYGGSNGAGTYAGLSREREALSLFGSVSLSSTRTSTTNRDLRENLLARPLTFLEQTGSTSNRGRSAIVDAGGELRASPRLTAWASATGTTWRYDGDGRMAYVFQDSMLAPLGRLQQLGAGGNVHGSGDAVLGARWAPQPQRHQLVLEARATGGDDDVDARYTREALDAAGLPISAQELLTVNTTQGTDRQLSFQADYVHPLGEKGRLEAGGRLLDRSSRNDVALALFPPPGSATPASSRPGGYLHTERFRSGYLTLRGGIGKASIQSGVRLEGASTRFRVGSTGQSYARDGIDAFPSANLSVPLGAGRQFRIAYSRRIERPIAYLLNPDIPVTDSLNRSEGNPTLLPKYTQNVTADLTWAARSGTLRLSPYYRRVVDNWDQVKRVDAQGAAVLTWENLSSVTSYGATATAWLASDRRAGGFASVGVFRELRDAGNLSPELSGSAVRLTGSANGTFKATPSLLLQATGFYSPARDLPQGHISATVLTTVAAKRTLGSRARLSLSVTDPFGIWRYSFVTRDDTHMQTSHNTVSMRTVVLYASYSFGHPTRQSRRQPVSEPPQPQADVRIH